MTTPHESHTRMYSHINGTAAEVIDRLAVAELCKGWPAYRDNSEWKNYRSLFMKDAYVWTTWSGRQHIDDFIKISRDGKAKGVFIQHRETGTAVELNQAADRAIGKMKATITQRFTAPATEDHEPIVYDVDCDCRFIFFCRRDDSGGWKAKYVKLVYEKDKVIPVDGKTAPTFPKEILDKYPEGYKYLGAAQSSLGYKVDENLATLDQRYWSHMYSSMEKWLAGDSDPGLSWEDLPKDSVTKAGPSDN
ncbi:hypothetical protein B0I35DRAFT_483333 [Stachybotrys elegans]|uniref:SnoaL-like domain-containing protein n=1 Tax=Stachybotrys elegans TaxID=80388 RepID=A0A8K0SH42_9HYPO|nr:hypothetical protein B0I35DRAFT_483333 [Stachybotrys elegans]